MQHLHDLAKDLADTIKIQASFNPGHKGSATFCARP